MQVLNGTGPGVRGVSVLRWLATPIANLLWKPPGIWQQRQSR